MFYGNLTAPVGITFAVQIKGFVYLHIGKIRSLRAAGFTANKGGLPHATGEVCAFLIGLTSRGVFVIIAV